MPTRIPSMPDMDDDGFSREELAREAIRRAYDQYAEDHVDQMIDWPDLVATLVEAYLRERL